MHKYRTLAFVVGAIFTLPLTAYAQMDPSPPSVFSCDVVPFPITNSSGLKSIQSDLLKDLQFSGQWWGRGQSYQTVPSTLPAASDPDWKHYNNSLGYISNNFVWGSNPAMVGFNNEQITLAQYVKPNEFGAFQYRFELAPEVNLSTLTINQLGMEATDPVVRIFANGLPVTASATVVPAGARNAPPTGAATATVVLDNPQWKEGLNTLEVVEQYTENVVSQNIYSPTSSPAPELAFIPHGIQASANCDPQVTLSPPLPVLTGASATLRGQVPSPRIPAGTPVQLDILDGSGAVLATLRTTVQADGSYEASQPINLPPASYRVRPTFGTSAPNFFEDASVVVDLQVLPVTQAQTISFTSSPPNNATVGDATYNVTATATSSLTVSLTSTTPEVCTIANGSVSFIAPGTCTLAANQAGDSNWEPGAQVEQSFLVAGSPTTPTNPAKEAVAVPTLGSAALALLAGLAAALGAVGIRRKPGA